MLSIFSRLLVTVLASLTLFGCAFHQTPYAMYEGTPSFANTTVFVAIDEKQTKHTVVGIQLIDGKEPSCWQVGCPIWTRLLPGTHKFTVRYSTDYGLAASAITYRSAALDIEVKDMKPRHVYVARYRESSDQVGVVVEDLGENPDFGIWIGLEGANRKHYKVSF